MDEWWIYRWWSIDYFILQCTSVTSDFIRNYFKPIWWKAFSKSQSSTSASHLLNELWQSNKFKLDVYSINYFLFVVHCIGRTYWMYRHRWQWLSPYMIYSNSECTESVKPSFKIVRKSEWHSCTKTNGDNKERMEPEWRERVCLCVCVCRARMRTEKRIIVDCIK